VSVAPDALAPYVRLALDCVHREYPNQISHRLESDADLRPPRELHPAFYGCYDWHSAVHGHWLLARALHLCPEASFAEEAAASLEENLRPAAIAGEVGYLRARPAFERPYGLAWLLQLDAELHEMGSPHAPTLAPLTKVARDHLAGWLPKLAHPVRSGTHSQTAFALGLALDWARARGDQELGALIEKRARVYFGADEGHRLAFEPSGEDFLSPAFGAADLMRRVLSPEALAAWLERAIPQIPHTLGAPWWAPVSPSDPEDGRLAHLDGLNLARAFMLDGVLGSLPAEDPRIPALTEARDVHQVHGLRGASFHSYSGAHWLGTFATYLLTRRGIAGASAPAR
jgi:hypothetical protein